MKKHFLLIVITILVSTNLAFSQTSATDIAAGLKAVDEHTLVGERSFLTGYDPINADGTVNVVVEIPAGSTAKWEVSKIDGHLKRDFKDRQPRTVRYLGYPANYGMVPRTVLPKELGGDGDPLDIVVLGEALPRGSVVKARVIGILKLFENGEQDDKLIAVREDDHFATVQDLDDLNQHFPGVTTILETWFLNYKGPGVFESEGFLDVDEAERVLERAIEVFSD